MEREFLNDNYENKSFITIFDILVFFMFTPKKDHLSVK